MCAKRLGCFTALSLALKPQANQRIFDTFAQSSSVYDPQKKRPTLQIYVSPAPNDSGLTLGALYAVSPPAVTQQKEL